MSGTQWSRDEYLVTLDLYLNHPDIVEDQTDPEIQEVASLIGRSPGAVALRLANFRHLDPSSTEGMSHVSNDSERIWEEYHDKHRELAIEADRARKRLASGTDDSLGRDESARTIDEARTGEATTETSTRLGQADFRQIVLDRYAHQCLLCDVREPGLLIAGHILPWAEFENERGDPENGLVLCYNHHEAFDLGMFTLSHEYECVVRPNFSPEGTFLNRTIVERDGDPIHFPNEPPSKEYLKEHNHRIPWWPPE